MRLAVAMLVLGSAAASGQTVRGTVVDDVDRRPVPGVLVTLVQANGTDIPPGARTDSAGRFVLYAARQGTYRVRAVRIGYRPSLGDPVLLEVGGLVVLQVAVGANAPRSGWWNGGSSRYRS